MTAIEPLRADPARTLLTLRDLTDPAQGPHALQLLVAAIERELADTWAIPVHQHRPNPVVPIVDNYDRLGYPPDAIARDTRYSRYLSDELMLRAHTSAAMPDLHRRVAAGSLHAGERDLVLTVPGLAYRRDAVDRHHVGEPHQLDVWRLRRDGAPLTVDDLEHLIATIVEVAAPGRRWRTEPREHPYTVRGRQVDVATDDGGWLEIAECGLTHPTVLRDAGLDRTASGLALGMGLDRLLMLRKGIDDIRLLRATDPRIASQMVDLAPYRPVSSMPPVRRDLSIAVAADQDAELLGDRVRAALGDDATSVEAIEVLSRTPIDGLPPQAVARLGGRTGQDNVLVRIVLRDLDRTLTADEANVLRDRVYAALHEGDVHQWAATGPPATGP
jgi:phenylalanyl-tRNA synthetase alpha chain